MVIYLFLFMFCFLFILFVFFEFWILNFEFNTLFIIVFPKISQVLSLLYVCSIRHFYLPKWMELRQWPDWTKLQQKQKDQQHVQSKVNPQRFQVLCILLCHNHTKSYLNYHHQRQSQQIRSQWFLDYHLYLKVNSLFSNLYDKCHFHEVSLNREEVVQSIKKRFVHWFQHS